MAFKKVRAVVRGLIRLKATPITQKHIVEANTVKTYFPFDRLPIELFHQIVDKLEDEYDAADLRNCSLVCTSWRHVSQLRLFAAASRIVVTGNANVFGSFFRYVEERPDIAAIIKSIKLGNSKRDTLDTVAFAAALERLVSLEHLFLVHLVLNIVPQSRSAELPRRKLKYLEGHSLTTKDPHVDGNDVFSTLLNILPVSEVDRLELRDCPRFCTNSGGEVLDTSGEAEHCSIDVHKIIFSRTTSNPVHFRSLQRIVNHKSLQALQVKCGSWESIKQFRVFLRACGKTLQTLDLSITWLTEITDAHPPAPWDALRDAIAACTNLEGFRLRILPNARSNNYFIEHDGTKRPLSIYANTVCALAPSVRVIEVLFVAAWDTTLTEEYLELWDIAAFDRAFAEGAFPRLYIVVFLIDMPEFAPYADAHYVAGRLRQALPRVCRRDLVGYRAVFNDEELVPEFSLAHGHYAHTL